MNCVRRCAVTGVANVTYAEDAISVSSAEVDQLG
jgi:hypothetical protein